MADGRFDDVRHLACAIGAAALLLGALFFLLPQRGLRCGDEGVMVDGQCLTRPSEPGNRRSAPRPVTDEDLDAYRDGQREAGAVFLIAGPALVAGVYLVTFRRRPR
ncbi:hypothetical protein ACWCXC_25665 [Streptomyces sp. NPDC001515]